MIPFIDTHEIPKAPKNIKQSVRKYNVSEVINHFSNEIPQPQHEQNRESQDGQAQESFHNLILSAQDRACSQNLQPESTQPMLHTQHNSVI